MANYYIVNVGTEFISVMGYETIAESAEAITEKSIVCGVRGYEIKIKGILNKMGLGNESGAYRDKIREIRRLYPKHRVAIF